MFLDDAVLAGLLVVGATCLFLGGVWWFIYQDIHKDDHKHETKQS